MHTGGCEQFTRMSVRQFQGGLAAFCTGAGDNYLHDPGIVCACEYFAAVFVERVVCQVTANVNQIHLSSLVIVVLNVRALYRIFRTCLIPDLRPGRDRRFAFASRILVQYTGRPVRIA
jgi:hypothetical protein